MYKVWYNEGLFHWGSEEAFLKAFEQAGEVYLMEGYTCPTQVEVERIVNALNKSNLIKPIK